MEFNHSRKIYPLNMGKELLQQKQATKAGLDATKTACRKVVHKTAEIRG